MKPVLSLAALLVVVLVSVPLAQPPDPGPLPVVGCPDSDPCPDPSRPWMRGSIEIQCAITSELEQVKLTVPGRNVVACHCQHHCNPMDAMAEETNDRAWDAQCAARCSPAGCKCPNPCESE